MKHLPGARAELFDAAEYHERREPGLGLRFLAAIDDAADFIVSHPDGGPIVLLPGLTRAVRRRVVATFPYVLFYVVEPAPLIVAVAHGRRRPGYWVDHLR